MNTDDQAKQERMAALNRRHAAERAELSRRHAEEIGADLDGAPAASAAGSATAADRVATFIEAFLANETRHGFPAILTIAGEATGHKDMSLNGDDITELVTPELRLLAAMSAIVADEKAEELAFRFGTANRVLFQLDLDEDALDEMAAKLNQLDEALRLARDRVSTFLHQARRKRFEVERRDREQRPETVPDGVTEK